MNSLLIVDDEPGVRALISRWGPSHGYTVAEAESADAALEWMRDGHPDVVLCDVNMPHRNGAWLAGQLLTHFPKTALVMTTGVGPDAAAATLPEGALACLQKPFTFHELEAVLEHARDWQLEQATARLWRPA